MYRLSRVRGADLRVWLFAAALGVSKHYERGSFGLPTSLTKSFCLRSILSMHQPVVFPGISDWFPPRHRPFRQQHDRPDWQQRGPRSKVPSLLNAISIPQAPKSGDVIGHSSKWQPLWCFRTNENLQFGEHARHSGSSRQVAAAHTPSLVNSWNMLIHPQWRRNKLRSEPNRSYLSRRFHPIPVRQHVEQI